jgi:RsiW-degrading membrane proteinase PrsW (M82 family)
MLKNKTAVPANKIEASLVLLACALQLFCALAVLVLFSCLFVLADSPGCQQSSCLLGSFLSGYLSLLFVFSGVCS